MRRPQSLAYLADARYFAEKYMGAEAVRTLTEIAYSCTLDNGGMPRYFEDIMDISRCCMKNSPEDKAFVYEHCLSFVREAFLSQTLSREEYLTAKSSVKALFEENGDSFEQAFIGSLDSGVISAQLGSIKKKWILLELAELLCRDAAASGKDLYSRDCSLMLSAVYHAVSSETDERQALIGVYSDMFADFEDKLRFCDSLLAKAAGDPASCADLTASLAQLALDSSDAERTALFAFMAESPCRRQLFEACCERCGSAVLGDALRL